MKIVYNEIELDGLYKKLEKYIESITDDNRREKLFKMFEDNKMEFMMSPASSSPNHHSAFPGGLLYHTLNVISGVLYNYTLWEKMGSDMSDITKESLLFCAIVHDFGKIDEYTPNDSEWHVINLRKNFKKNTAIRNMRVQDRTLWYLQKYGIEITQDEYISILIHDGLYDEANKFYYNQIDAEYKLNNSMPYILHSSDMMASRIEFEKYKPKRK